MILTLSESLFCCERRDKLSLEMPCVTGINVMWKVALVRICESIEYMSHVRVKLNFFFPFPETICSVF